jgi:hypothetical protein
VADLLDVLEAELRAVGFVPSQRAILTADAPRWAWGKLKAES